MSNFEEKQLLSTYKGALALLKHYDELYSELKGLKAKLAILQEKPELKELPPKPDMEEPSGGHGVIIALIGLILCVAFFAIDIFNLIPATIFIPKLRINFFSYDLNEISLVGIGILAIFLIIAIVKESVASIKLDKYYDALLEYEEKVEKITKENEEIEAESKVNLEEAKLLELKISSTQTTLKHLQTEYMKTYSKVIPLELASIEKLESAIDTIESA